MFDIVPWQDVPHLRPLVRHFFDMAVLEAYPELLQLGAVTRRERLDALRERHEEVPDRRIWLARREREVCGMVWLEPEWHPITEVGHWLVVSLAVEPAWRRQGIAGGLLRHALKEANAHAPLPARLFVAAHNTAARSLYQRMGFTPTTLELRRTPEPPATPPD
ncbi:MAG: GNAT family N-acetyltransferase [Candidatus Sericytochromatia bacterium]|nr:GNAT family N-acetyltransferase [Candidatus Sericytochromatia bacterium]